MALASLSSLMLMTFLTVTIKHVLKIDNVSFSSVYQGAMRFNTYIGLALVSTVFAERGLVIAVIIASILIPAVNICAVISLQHYHPKKVTL